MIKAALKIFIWMHNISYKAISALVVRENNGLHPKHKILNYHKFFLDNVSENDTVLDIGCGNGAVAYDLSQKSKRVIAIDIVKNNIEIAREKFSHENLEYIRGDATNFNFQEKFDVIILSNVLEHIKNRIEFLSKIKNLAPKILIRVPLLTRDWLSVYKKENGFEYRLDSTHYIEYTEENFKDELEKSGLEIENYYIKFGELYATIKQN
ncbi:MAG: class I SAM-dependent methyltransferase [Candidatus Moranbacteria bacterium]|nr:class I SAM-dependent methyltransferase [Candidatus Moranbacteria bacterium]